MTASAPDPARECVVAPLRLLAKGWPDDLLEPGRPALLAREQAGGEMLWYGVAHSPRQAREFREALLAFVGPAYSDFAGQPADWNRDDPLEAALEAVTPHGFRLSVRPGEASAVVRLLERLRQLLRERPARERTDPPPLGRLLRDFDLLLRARDWPGASGLLDRLRDRGQLNADQLAGLKLRLLAAQERWAEILSAPELPALVAQRLPVAVAEAVAAAVYHQELARFSDEVAAVDYFRDQVAPAFGLLFRGRSGWHHPDALRAAALADAASRAAAPAPPADAYSRAVDAYDANDPKRAFDLLLPGPSNPEAVRLLIDAALDLGTREAALAAVAAISACQDEIRQRALSRRATRALWGKLEEAASDPDTPADWSDWLDRAASGPWSGAAAAADRGVDGWPRPDPSSLEKALTDHSAAVMPAIREALPSLLRVILPEGKADPRLGATYRLILEGLALDDDLSPATAPAVAELAEAALRSGPVASASRNLVRQVIEMLTLAWERLKRPDLFDWGLELLDLVAAQSVHRSADVAPLAQDVAAEFGRAPRRVTPGQRALLRVICAELGVPAASELAIAPPEPGAPTPGDEAAELRRKLGRRSVVLLTLHDRIAANFRKLMRANYPQASVDVIQEYAGTRRLRDLAQNADVFIVNIHDAKHAATNYVRQHRPDDATTLYPVERNAARQLDALEAWLLSIA